MKRHVSLAVDVAWEASFAFEALAGIRDFTSARPRWFVQYLRSAMGDQGVGPAAWRPDAAVGGFLSKPFHDAFPNYKGPFVAMGYECEADVTIGRDDRAIGRLAAEHLLERGYRRFAFVHSHQSPTDKFSERRLEGFQQRLSDDGFECSVSPGGTFRWVPESPLTTWVQSLPRPCGVFCANDNVGADFIAICRYYGKRVPEDFAVVGADNDPMWCEMCQPSMSSVIVGWRRVGFEATRWAERLLKGRKPPKGGVVLVQPTGVAARRSTDMLPIDDPHVAQAMAYLREHACEGLSLKQVVADLPMGRRHLEQAFRKCLKRTPHQEIRRIQIEEAKTILARTDLSLADVAKKVGLSAAHFSVTFRRVAGKTPGQFRREHRVRDW